LKALSDFWNSPKCTTFSIGHDRGERFVQRIRLFYWWGEQLVAAQAGAKVVAL
jgi:hypothetical protein